MNTTTTPSQMGIIIETAKEAVADAIEVHRRMGRSIVVMEQGQIKHIKARDLKPRALPGDEIEDD